MPPRVAYVFACNEYADGSGFSRLQHANKKASELTEKLQLIGWDARKCLNACRSDFISQRTVLLQNLQPQTIVLLHFGGHAFISGDGQLYLACRDSQAQDPTTYVNLYEWLQPLHDLTSSKGVGRLEIARNNCADVVPGCATLAVLDCCRDLQKFIAPAGPPSEISQLRRNDTEMVILYACEVGRQALEEDDSGSVYLTDAFMEAILEEAGKSLPHILHAVRDKVLRKSLGFQKAKCDDGMGEKAFEIVLNPMNTGPATSIGHGTSENPTNTVSATSIGHGISDEEWVTRDDQQSSTSGMTTNHLSDVPLVFWIITAFLQKSSVALWLCGFARKEWSTRGTFMPFLIATHWVSFSHDRGDFWHGNIHCISCCLSSLRQNWLALEWTIYCINFPCHLLIRVFGEALRDRDYERAGKTMFHVVGAVIAASFLAPQISGWRTYADRSDEVRLKTSKWWQAFGGCAVGLMTVNIALLAGEAPPSCLDKIHYVYMILLVVGLTDPLSPTIFRSVHQRWFWSYVLALVALLAATLLLKGTNEHEEGAGSTYAEGGTGGTVWTWNPDYNWAMVYILFFAYPVISAYTRMRFELF